MPIVVRKPTLGGEPPAAAPETPPEAPKEISESV